MTWRKDRAEKSRVEFHPEKSVGSRNASNNAPMGVGGEERKKKG